MKFRSTLVFVLFALFTTFSFAGDEGDVSPGILLGKARKSGNCGLTAHIAVSMDPSSKSVRVETGGEAGGHCKWQWQSYLIFLSNPETGAFADVSGGCGDELHAVDFDHGLRYTHFEVALDVYDVFWEKGGIHGRHKVHLFLEGDYNQP